MPRSAISSAFAGAPSWRRGSSLPDADDCLFCKLFRDGDHVNATEGFVAIRDIHPRAPVHLLVIPQRHIETFKEISALDSHETKAMLDFIAETAAHEGLDSYRVAVNCGADAGQTVYHLHWHVLGGRRLGPEG
jgi:histidine triad (HIT) family protein